MIFKHFSGCFILPRLKTQELLLWTDVYCLEYGYLALFFVVVFGFFLFVFKVYISAKQQFREIKIKAQLVGQNKVSLDKLLTPLYKNQQKYYL